MSRKVTHKMFNERSCILVIPCKPQHMNSEGMCENCGWVGEKLLNSKEPK